MLNTQDFYSNKLFSLSINQAENQTSIIMKMLIPIVSTYSLPATYPLLEKYFPQVLKTKCFNENNFSFSQEVKKTEIGHLFEHILLEYMYQHKLADGIADAVFNGVTEWDWKKDKEGLFHIKLDVGVNETEVFYKALDKTINLLNFIFYSLMPWITKELSKGYSAAKLRSSSFREKSNLDEVLSSSASTTSTII